MIRCPKCGSNEFHIHGVQHLRLHVSFPPEDTEPVIHEARSDSEPEWAEGAPTVCLACGHETTFSALTDPPRPVTLSRLRDLDPGTLPAGLASECLEHLLEGQPQGLALTDADLLTHVAEYRVDRQNWEAACDDLRDSALEAATDACEARR